MAISTFSVRMESDVKNELDKICAQLGLNTSVAIFLPERSFARNGFHLKSRLPPAKQPGRMRFKLYANRRKPMVFKGCLYLKSILK
mgnify:CR=1 FL=1